MSYIVLDTSQNSNPMVENWVNKDVVISGSFPLQSQSVMRMMIYFISIQHFLLLVMMMMMVMMHLIEIALVHDHNSLLRSIKFPIKCISMSFFVIITIIIIIIIDHYHHPMTIAMINIKIISILAVIIFAIPSCDH